MNRSTLFFILNGFLVFGFVRSLTIKDLRPCPNTAAPLLNSVVLINCTSEPCFFGKVNGLSFQFILTPDHHASSVNLQLTAVDGYGNNYDIDTVQRTSCADSYCEMEANVPRCFAAGVRRRYAPDNDQADYFTFQARFTDSKGYCVACSRFVLNTFIRYTRETYDYTTTSRPYYPNQFTTHGTIYGPTTSRPIYTTNRPYGLQPTQSPFIGSEAIKPIGSSFSFDKKEN
ncbi:uncharacterized protein LOC107368719 [Tetranychus urticae]|uniref:Uncharacterized protein n=1 Tax=Tetranychus urticae TaxID=32264 RepID=T1KZR5_TETUR|nr:uncharacterized protein LOC107368719 [Tetranychus urticae]